MSYRPKDQNVYVTREEFERKLKECCNKKPKPTVIQLGNHIYEIKGRRQQIPNDNIYKSFNSKTSTFGVTLIL